MQATVISPQNSTHPTLASRKCIRPRHAQAGTGQFSPWEESDPRERLRPHPQPPTTPDPGPGGIAGNRAPGKYRPRRPRHGHPWDPPQDPHPARTAIPSGPRGGNPAIPDQALTTSATINPAKMWREWDNRSKNTPAPPPFGKFLPGKLPLPKSRLNRTFPQV